MCVFFFVRTHSKRVQWTVHCIRFYEVKIYSITFSRQNSINKMRMCVHNEILVSHFFRHFKQFSMERRWKISDKKYENHVIPRKNSLFTYSVCRDSQFSVDIKVFKTCVRAPHTQKTPYALRKRSTILFRFTKLYWCNQDNWNFWWWIFFRSSQDVPYFWWAPKLGLFLNVRNFNGDQISCVEM